MNMTPITFVQCSAIEEQSRSSGQVQSQAPNPIGRTPLLSPLLLKAIPVGSRTSAGWAPVTTISRNYRSAVELAAALAFWPSTSLGPKDIACTSRRDTGHPTATGAPRSFRVEQLRLPTFPLCSSHLWWLHPSKKQQSVNLCSFLQDCRKGN